MVTVVEAPSGPLVVHHYLRLPSGNRNVLLRPRVNPLVLLAPAVEMLKVPQRGAGSTKGGRRVGASRWDTLETSVGNEAEAASTSATHSIAMESRRGDDASEDAARLLHPARSFRRARGLSRGALAQISTRSK